jgi:anti-sigma factor RsiW
MSEQDARDRLVSGLREGLTRAAAESEPIDYDTLEAYVDDRLDEADREIVDTRLADDPELRREVEELRALRALLPGTAEVSAPAPPEKRVVLPIDSGRRAPARARSFWQVSPTFAAAASVVLLLGVGAAWWFRARIGVAPADQRIAGGATPSGSAPSGAGRPASRPTTRPTEPAASPGSAGSETRVRDGEHLVALTADRSVTGLEALDPAMRARVGEMLASGKLPSSAAGLQGSAGQLLSAPRTGQPSAAAFGVRAPVGVAVRDAQPLFYWAPAPGASSYHVRVVDESLELVAESEAVVKPTWRPRLPLPRGRVLQWQVEAIIASGNLLSPVPPAPEARFRVLTEAEDTALSRALDASRGSSLAALYLYAEAGLRNDARRALSALLKSNPDSPVLQRLYADLRQR